MSSGLCLLLMRLFYCDVQLESSSIEALLVERSFISSLLAQMILVPFCFKHFPASSWPFLCGCCVWVVVIFKALQWSLKRF